MPTTVVKTIGAGGDYADTAAFLADLPASLVDLDEQWVGEYIDEAEEVYTAQITGATCTTDATRNVILRPATGLSFADKADAATQPLIYNASRGKGLRLNQTYIVGFFNLSTANVIIERLQIRVDNRTSTRAIATGIFPEFRRCILQSDGTGSSLFTWTSTSTARRTSNCAIIAPSLTRLDSNGGSAKWSYDEHATIVLSQTGVDFVYRSDYGHTVAPKNSFFAWGTGAWKSANVTVNAAATNNAGTLGDVGGANALLNLAVADQLEGATTDLRVKSGAALIGAGAAGVQSVDIFGRTRSAASPTIGAMEWIAGDTTAPTLTSPTATATGTTTASGTVSTNEANGTLYYLASTNASEDAATVKAASSQAVSATGSQSVSFTGLTASTTYYAHYVHRDAAGNDSAVATSASFTTSAAGDTTPPTLTGSITISALTTTSYTASWPAGSDDTAVTGYEYRIAGGSWVDAGDVLTVDITGRTPGASETFEVRAYDAVPNYSSALSTSVTLNSATATVTVTEPLKNNTGTLLASQSGITVAVLQAADLVSVYEAIGLTTNASGLLAAISNAAMTTGQQYHVAIKLADGGVGITGPITAS